MKLYYAPGACSLAPHIALAEAGLAYALDKVDFATGKTESGVDYRTINPLGAVPALQFDDGSVLTEAAVIQQYIADQKPDAKLSPVCGTRERYTLQRWLNFIATEVHKGLSPLFKPATPDTYRTVVVDTLASRFDLLEKQLAGGPYITGQQFTIVDGYAFTVLRWTGFLKVSLDRWPGIRAFADRVAARPGVQQAMREEGLIK